MTYSTFMIPGRPGLLHRVLEAWGRNTLRTTNPASGERCPLRPGLLRDAGIAAADAERDLAVSDGGVGGYAATMGRDGLELRRSRSIWQGTTLPV